MPTPGTILVDLDVQLSPHARALLDGLTANRGPEPGDAFWQAGPPGAAPSERLRAWLAAEATGIVAAGRLAGAGGALIVDDALTRLEQLVERVAQTENERGALQRDLVALHGAWQREAQAAVELRANLRRIAANAGSFELTPDAPGTHHGTAVGSALERILALCGPTAPGADEIRNAYAEGVPLDPYLACPSSRSGQRCRLFAGHADHHEALEVTWWDE